LNPDDNDRLIKGDAQIAREQRDIDTMIKGTKKLNNDLQKLKKTEDKKRKDYKKFEKAVEKPIAPTKASKVKFVLAAGAQPMVAGEAAAPAPAKHARAGKRAGKRAPAAAAGRRNTLAAVVGTVETVDADVQKEQAQKPQVAGDVKAVNNMEKTLEADAEGTEQTEGKIVASFGN